MINNQDNFKEDFSHYLTLLFLLVVLVDPLAPSFPVHPAFHLQPLHVQELLLYLQEVLKYSSLCYTLLIETYLIHEILIKILLNIDLLYLEAQGVQTFHLFLACREDLASQGFLVFLVVPIRKIRSFQRCLLCYI